ncbi:M10 family metallopeptidase C-terminal domain-containing protein (plasmid) [Limimaricola variabilis]|uniref:M10 family metallopeptidase C-terminal domain-containing protein n=1 Tax=Limimaricola variabilis TaxID=1492771 RepID=UPI002AC93E85|nr:M10 family metallopeptidase C-terminal domain-containing protein [Limimaricola variabilis]WPY97050.1 M10 family metallopeptidase C-terminal domain-containing protein [Limimaricola variabilis]
MATHGTAEQFAEYLRSGYHREAGQTPYFFSADDARLITVDLSGLDAGGKVLARRAMSAWESAVDVSFQETSGRAKLSFIDNASGAWAQTEYWSDGTVNKAVVNVSADWVARYGTSVDSYSYRTYLHEIGHVLGLGHTANYGDEASAHDAHYDNDSWQMSVMSYLGQDQNPNVSASRAVNVTPMEADLIALRALYGASEKGSTAGNTVWGRNSNLDTPLGEMFRAMEQSNAESYKGDEGFTFYLEDEGGRDLIDFAHDTRGQSVDLRGGRASSLLGEVENMLIARDTVIEQYRAGSGHDKVSGNGANNKIWGNEGDDKLIGRGGNDRLLGQQGDDHLRGGGGKDRLFGGGGDDVLKGGSHNDLLKGHSGADRLYGQNGRDTLKGGGGNDLLKGGNKQDTLKGGSGDDQLEGQSHRDRLYGQKGDDRLFGGKGNDRLDGGQGNDLLAGGEHSDLMTGGWGADRFVFDAGEDRITDHATGVDRIQFDLSEIAGAENMSLQDLRELAREVDGDVAFDFGSGNRLLVENQTLAGVTSDLDII